MQVYLKETKKLAKKANKKPNAKAKPPVKKRAKSTSKSEKVVKKEKILHRPACATADRWTTFYNTVKRHKQNHKVFRNFQHLVRAIRRIAST